MVPRSDLRRPFAAVAWSVLAFTVLVVLGGSVVRATGSGAGCGDHWPRCQGQILPTSPSAETVIEFTHRAMTGLAAVGFVVMIVLAFRAFTTGHPVRRWVTVALVLFIVEALIGAVLVLYGWVDDDASLGRLIVVPLHLVNTFFLIASLALTAWWGSGRPAPPRLRWDATTRRLAAMGGLLLLVAVLGAWNALADTLHPADSVGGGVAAELADDSPFLLRIRVLHPIVAVAAGLVVASMAVALAEGASGRSRRLGIATAAIVFAQFLVGVLNLFLLTPVETQVLHLAVADALWITFVLFAAAVLAEQPAPRPVVVA